VCTKIGTAIMLQPEPQMVALSRISVVVLAVLPLPTFIPEAHIHNDRSYVDSHQITNT
jgi:hypothetical protein